ncbi:MAG: indolepyruvate ferredoxin oxidoreductase [Kiritimatiellae bacterium]|nr:indolepyruvate ferredoxin oxidoreductase [Kiritimatiellia bacterium]
MQERLLLLGDEAVAQGALDAGLTASYAYPGTPSTEILEYIQRSPETAARGIHCQWSSNEKTAVEEALGVSYTGKRALAAMKHVGLNVAADPFINAAITGANGGLVVAVCDDPSMYSSQNEQDSRYYAKFAMVPTLEPANQQEAYDMAFEAFDLSEQTGLPVLLRMTTRLAHSRADVARRKPRAPNALNLPQNPTQYILLPANARRNFVALVDKQADLLARAEASRYNDLCDGPDKSIGIIAAGVALNYVREVFREGMCPHPVLKIGQYPLPSALVARLLGMCESVLVVEEGYPFVEELVRGVLPGPTKIRGRLDGSLPRVGELTPEHLVVALNLDLMDSVSPPDVVRPRMPQLCQGCPHRDTYAFLNEVMAGYKDARVFSDIGCYTLGALSPFHAIHTCVEMGASVTMAKGAADAGLRPAVAVIGDSTFTHSGITGLLDAVYEGTPLTVIILDNGTTAMTGMQASPATGRLESIVTGLGVDPKHVRALTPLAKHHAENVKALREEVDYNGVSVVIARRECIHLKGKG